MDDKFVIAWGLIKGTEVHDAGGMNGVGNLLIALETALMYQANVREPMDFFVMAVPKSHTDVIHKDFEARFGNRLQTLN